VQVGESRARQLLCMGRKGRPNFSTLLPASSLLLRALSAARALDLPLTAPYLLQRSVVRLDLAAAALNAGTV